MQIRVLGLMLLAVCLSACGTRSDGSVSPVLGAAPTASAAAKPAPRSASQITVSENDITDRPYRALGDISVTVSKWTIFDADPTRAKVNEALQEKAAALGADAVILARYGTVGLGVFTWGKLDGNGRAVAFDK
jgi:hypothetical protein